MASNYKYAAQSALKVIDGILSSDLSLHRFDKLTRSKAHLFAIKGRQGKQFAIILGDIDKATGVFSAQQTRIVLNKCVPPSINGIDLIFTPYKGSRVLAQDSKLTLTNQTSCLVADETALTELLRWYARHEL